MQGRRDLRSVRKIGFYRARFGKVRWSEAGGGILNLVTGFYKARCGKVRFGCIWYGKAGHCKARS